MMKSNEDEAWERIKAICEKSEDELKPSAYEWGHSKHGFIKRGNWQFSIGGEMGLRVSGLENAPCWFHRLAQKYILGVVWRKME